MTDENRIIDLEKIIPDFDYKDKKERIRIVESLSKKGYKFSDSIIERTIFAYKDINDEIRKINRDREDYSYGWIYDKKAEAKVCRVEIKSQEKIAKFLKQQEKENELNGCERRIKSLEEELTKIEKPIEEEYKKWEDLEEKMFEEKDASKAGEIYAEMRINRLYHRGWAWAGHTGTYPYDSNDKVFQRLRKKLGESFVKKVVEELGYSAPSWMMRLAGLTDKAFEKELRGDLENVFDNAKESKEKIKKVVNEYLRRHESGKYRGVVWGLPEEIADVCEKHKLFEEALKIYDSREDCHNRVREGWNSEHKLRMLKKLGRKEEALKMCEKYRRYSEAAILAKQLGITEKAELYKALSED